MEKNYIIYIHTSPSGRSYIGQTNNLRRRNTCHRNTDGCSAFHRAILKYGWDNFTHGILAEGLSREEANELEPFFIANHGTLSPGGYNLCTGGKNPQVSEETKAKISKSRQGIRLTEDQKRRLSEIGKCQTDEHRKKFQEGRLLASEKIRQAVSRANKGRQHSGEMKLKVSEVSKANWANPCYREKVIASRTGRKNTEETKRRMSEAAKARWAKEKQAA